MFEREFAKTAAKHGVKVKQNVGLNGLAVDMLAKMPNGQFVAFEVKPSKPADLARASEQLKRYRSALGTKNTFFVYEDLKASRVDQGLVASADFGQFHRNSCE